VDMEIEQRQASKISSSRVSKANTMPSRDARRNSPGGLCSARPVAAEHHVGKATYRLTGYQIFLHATLQMSNLVCMHVLCDFSLVLHMYNTMLPP
jgi:NO-binding membrane sensor protein with MHYT domain